MRNTILTAAAVLVLIVVFVSQQNGSGSTPSTSTPAGSTSAAPSAASKAAGIGTSVRDGQFEFTVTKIKSGVASVGAGALAQKAQGQFILVSVTVKNIGTEARMFDGSSQTLYDAQGRKFEADTGAAIYVDQSNSFLNNINPGNSVAGLVVFDVPKGATLTRIELHDSAFSGGVSTALK